VQTPVPDQNADPRPVLAIASGNRGKLVEFEGLLGDHVRVLSLTAFGVESPEETGRTFEENAALKARHLHGVAGTVVLAADSGLEIDALNGEPGVRSARYAGDDHDDAANRRLVLDRMANVPSGERTARFVAAIAIVDVYGNSSIVRGTCEGTITYSERGTGGFGYDSLFELPGGRTMAELSKSEKNAVSHRANAIRKALPALRLALHVPPPPDEVTT